MKFNMRLYGVIVGFIMILLSWSQSFFINYVIPLGIVAMVVSVANILVVKKHFSEKVYRACLSISALFVATEILWMIFDNIGLFAVAQVSFVVTGFAFLILALGMHTKINQSFQSIAVRISEWVLVLVLLLATSILIVFTITPKPVALYLQSSSGAENSYTAEPSTTTNIDGKYQLTTNIQYGGKYPRSFLNIITPDGAFDEERPTYFYVHGGGFVAGDSIGGDPNAGAALNTMLYHYELMVDHGYNVVTINYALAPEYIHPTPIKQLSEAVQFMQQNGEQYGINMNDVIFGGGSAGGFIAADFITIQANPEYAKDIDINPVIDLKDVRALVLEVPILDFSRGHRTVTEDIVTDYIFAQSGSAYIGQPVVSADQDILQSLNVIPRATSNFPPTFITDGNTGTFPDQAEEYYNRLTELGVKTDLYIPDIHVSKEVHGYMNTIDTEATRTYIQRKLAFLDSLD
ncbi:alpha/beta hydrolase [Paenibacillus sp. FSL K6-1318]|uniref:alpha/beta hydrolase n=1 Tax=Paenibacillus sp. FSL K6-1318 TaxID=2975291 RepID=UPI0030EE9077